MALRLFAFLLVFCAASATAGEKPITPFDSISGLDYYSAWGGTVSAATDTVTKHEGAGALRLDYSLAAGSGNFVEYLRNYGTSTQDYNFQPKGISVWIRGNGSSDKFKFQLFEDNNSNGAFQESGEEVWQWSSSTILSNTGWNKVTMLYTSFNKIAGSGGNVALDKTRIGKWRIVIDSPSGAAHATSSVWIDDLRLVNNYDIGPKTPKPLSGSFVQIWNTAGCACGNWSQSQWTTELQRMADLHMDTLIVQYGMFDDGSGTTTSFYPSSLGFVTYNQSTLDYIMAAAQATGIKVVVGLYFNANWDGNLDFDQPATYNAVDTRNIQVIDEIWTRYGANPAFGGWYIPQEIDDLRWQNATRRGLLAGMVQNMAARAKSKNAGLPVMISPFFGMNQPADVYRDWWTSFLAVATSVDWVIPQDGVGTNRTDVDTDVPYYFDAIKTAVTGAGRNFGVTAESFQQTSPTTFVATNIDRLKDQLKVAGDYTTRIFQFDWSYMEPGLGGANLQLYNDYAAWRAQQP